VEYCTSPWNGTIRSASSGFNYGSTVRKRSIGAQARRGRRIWYSYHWIYADQSQEQVLFTDTLYVVADKEFCLRSVKQPISSSPSVAGSGVITKARSSEVFQPNRG